MAETISAYNLASPEKAVPMDRAKFYADQLENFNKGKKPEWAVGLVNIFLFNNNGELLLQKRSFSKNHNPGLLDKSTGGHIQYGDLPDYTAMVETIQELQTPSVVLKDREDLLKTVKLLYSYLDTVAIMHYFKTDMCILPKIIDGKNVDVANNSYMYFGIYNGRIRPVDREAKGVLWYSIEELENEISKAPETFTPDMHYYFDKYKKDMVEFAQIVKSWQQS